MVRFEHAGFGIAYDDLRPPGEAAGTMLLVHGFATSRAECWRRLGWYAAFARQGWRIVAPDLRGHGDSDKPHDPAAYARTELAADLSALMDHLEIGRADVFGYSLGAHLAIGLALAHPERIDRLILGGVGGHAIDGRGPLRAGAMTLAEAMRAPDAEAISDPLLRGFRRFAEQQGDDRLALAACSEGAGRALNAADLAALDRPTLVVAGSLDALAGDPAVLAAALPSAKAVSLPGCDHFTAIPHALFKAAVFDFLDGWMDAPAFE
jgi:pimeloyl-ACP methyl ester carboxylesterase